MLTLYFCSLGFPVTAYNAEAGMPRPLSFNVSMTENAFREALAALYPEQGHRPFHACTVSRGLQLELLKEGQLTPAYLRSMGKKGYQGVLVLKVRASSDF